MNERLLFLGSGGGLGSPKDNFRSNVIITNEAGKMLLIDCGETFQPAIELANINPESIDALYVTHLHADHIGGLPWFALKRYFGPNGVLKHGRNGYKGPRIIANAEMMEDMWNKGLAAMLETVTGMPNTLETFFTVDAIPPNGSFMWEGIMFHMVQTVHTMDNRRLKPSFGLMFEINGTKIFFTGDTQFCPNQIRAFYEDADLIFQDCEIAKYPQSVHAQYHELCTLPEHVRKKMWLYHYDGQEPVDWKEMGFLGFVMRRQLFTF